jgi:hypothetical protein
MAAPEGCTTSMFREFSLSRIRVTADEPPILPDGDLNREEYQGWRVSAARASACKTSAHCTEEPSMWIEESLAWGGGWHEPEHRARGETPVDARGFCP